MRSAECGVRVRSVGAKCGCGVRVRSMGVECECGVRVWSVGVECGCGVSVRSVGAECGCGVSVCIAGVECICWGITATECADYCIRFRNEILTHSIKDDITNVSSAGFTLECSGWKFGSINRLYYIIVRTEFRTIIRGQAISIAKN